MRSKLVKIPFFIYRTLISPFIHLLAGAGAGCRFDPSCSVYGQQAIELHGWGRGGILALQRILRCHPFSRGGVDPVPPCDRDGSTRKVKPNGS